MKPRHRVDPRMNVSISSDLRIRMKKQASNVNWSKVASEAFERKLAELERDGGNQGSVCAAIVCIGSAEG
jgi:hypothetical protein